MTAVSISWIELQPDPLSFLYKGGSLFAEVLNSFLWMLCFRTVDADEADSFAVLQGRYVAIDDANDSTEFIGPMI